MAGEEVLSAFMQVLFDNLYTGATDELISIWGVSKELEGLEATLFLILSMLKDAERSN